MSKTYDEMTEEEKFDAGAWLIQRVKDLAVYNVFDQGCELLDCPYCGEIYVFFPNGIERYACWKDECWDKWEAEEEEKEAERKRKEEERKREAIARAEAAKRERIDREAEKILQGQKKEQKIKANPKKQVYDIDPFVKPRKRLKPNYIQDRQRTPTQDQREFIMKRDGGICQYCGDPGDVIDHILPFAHGGRTILSNLACACERCNSMLSAKVFGSFAEKRSWALQELDKRYFG